MEFFDGLTRKVTFLPSPSRNVRIQVLLLNSMPYATTYSSRRIRLSKFCYEIKTKVMVYYDPFGTFGLCKKWVQVPFQVLTEVPIMNPTFSYLLEESLGYLT